MNILMLSWRGPGHPNSGGAEINTLENVTAWTKAGHSVTWFTSTFPGAIPFEVVNKVKIVRRGSQNFKVNLSAFTWYLFKPHEKFDIVIDQFHGLPFFTPLYVKAPKLAFIHEVAREVWWLNPWPKPFNLIPAIVGSFLEPWIFRILYKDIPFMTVSNSTKEDLIKYGIPEENISVFLSGVNLSIPSPLPPKNKIPTIVFLGALSKDKGIEDALLTFSFISKLRSSWKFWVIGKGETNYQLYLDTLCQKLQVDKKVKFLGPVYSLKKFKLLSQSYILVNPSIREGWGLVNIEANAVGTPVVGYSVPGTRDSVRHQITGLLCPPHHPELLAKNAIRLIEDKRLYKRLISNSLRWSRQFSWDKFTKQSLNLIENLVGRK